MIENKTTFRVRYAEVDRMGYVYNGNYATYFEMGRTELMRENGVVYNDLEEKGIFMPLSEYSVKFYKSAHYDDVLSIVTKMLPPKGVRLTFEYSLFNSKNELLAEGNTILVFVDGKTRKPMRPPANLTKRFL